MGDRFKMSKAEPNPEPVSTSEKIPVVFNRLWISSENTVRVVFLYLHPRMPSLPFAMELSAKPPRKTLTEIRAVNVITVGTMLLFRKLKRVKS